jgi:hypothetical protein
MHKLMKNSTATVEKINREGQRQPGEGAKKSFFSTGGNNVAKPQESTKYRSLPYSTHALLPITQNFVGGYYGLLYASFLTNACKIFTLTIMLRPRKLE